MPQRESAAIAEIEDVRARIVPHPLKSGMSLLNPEELPEWDALVEASPAGSLFCKSWWLRAVCGEVRVLGYFEKGRLIAGIPLYYTRRMGLRYCGMPKLTQTMGVVMAPMVGKRVTLQSRETEVLSLFATHIAQEPIFVQAFHPASRNWLPFYWEGFTQTTHYTYVLDDLTSIDRIWDGLAAAKRTHIRKAQNQNLQVKECGPEIVFNAAVQTFSRQKKSCPYNLEYLCKLYGAAHSNGAGICMAAEDGEGRVHAASFFVWDNKRGYLLVSGYDSNLAAASGHDLLVWRLIEFATAHTAVFDFEGSMHKPIEASFRSFGGSLVAYNRIAKVPGWFRIALCAVGRKSV